MTSLVRFSHWCIRAAVFAASVAAIPALFAQAVNPKVTLTGGWRVPITEENRTVAVVSGQEARPTLDQLRVTKFRLETFRYDPDQKTDLVMESPSAAFDTKGATSDQAITLRSADGRLAVSGRGWLWSRATGLLVISNQVHTTMKRGEPGKKLAPIDLVADRLEYNIKTGDTRFLGHCVAEQPGEARIKAGEFASRLGIRGEQPDLITATNEVTIEILRSDRGGTASGAGAVYLADPAGDRIHLIGSTRWDFPAGSGSADELILFPARESYTARGSARMTLASGASPAAPAGPNREQKPRGHPLEVTASSIESTPGRVTLEGPVLATQVDGLELRAAKVVVQLTADAQPIPTRGGINQITAFNDVTARLPMAGHPVELRGQEMTYSVGEHVSIEVKGEPTWTTAASAGRGGRFIIHPEFPTFQAVDGVEVTWSGEGPEKARRSPIQLRAERMDLQPEEARFTGNVTARQSIWELSAANLSLALGTNASPRQVLARQDVVLVYSAPLPGVRTNLPVASPLIGFAEAGTEEMRQWTIAAGEMRAELSSDRSVDAFQATDGVEVAQASVKASGGRASYQAAEGRLRLTEGAQLRTAEGLEIDGEDRTALGLDVKTGSFFVEGPVKKMKLPAQALRARRSASATSR